ncbi:filamentous hemagglutinin N-terminal domain-containing protein [Campylobacter jejuni]|nr:filamentous hemagglutinin N-terminal domain-containing protein [Campylobacter jejuni]
MKKMSKHIVLSFAVSSLLFSQAYALPSGGKFTHGTSGAIHTSGNTVMITEKGQNHVIQWGGGFNIAQGKSVNFTTSGKNYLNIAYHKDASKIDGALNGGNNNIFLVNPMGVLIGQTGTITAGKFVASTTPLNDENVKTFLKQGASFSPAFDVSKQGNIINLGKINADNIVLIGNKVEINKGKITLDVLKLEGNKVYVDAGVVKDTKNIVAKAEQEAIIQQSITSFEENGALLGNSSSKFSFDDSSKVKNWTKYGSIADATEWNKFADFWNVNKEKFRTAFDHFRLIDDIDFSGVKTYIVGDNTSNAFADSFTKATDAVKLSKDDFDPKLLQRILDDLMNGKYTYDFDTKTWIYADSKGVAGENEASEITQSLNFLNTFKDTGVEQEFLKLWQGSQEQSYKNYTNLYEKWTQKKTAMDKIKTGKGCFASFKEELQKYQEALAQLDKENKNYEKIKESGLVSDETLRVMYAKLLEQKEALEKQFADLSGNEGFHYKLENEILNSQGFAINGSDVDGKVYTGKYNFEGKLASLPEKSNISIYEPDKQKKREGVKIQTNLLYCRLKFLKRL